MDIVPRRLLPVDSPDNHVKPRSMSDKPNLLIRLFRGTWRLIDFSRRIAHLTFLLIFFTVVGGVIVATSGERVILVRDGTALIVAPEGMVVEQYSVEPTERAISRLMDEETPETRMRDLIQSIQLATTDDRIQRMVIDTDYLWGIGVSKLQELKGIISEFKATGKEVIAYGHGMSQHQYYLASLADEVWLHPEGLVLLEGYGVYRNYYKEGLDKLSVDVHLFRVGEYKSAAEPFVRNDMSDFSREANRYWLDSLWEEVLEDLAANRGMRPEQLSEHVEQFAERLREAGGRGSEAALEAGLVDRLATRDELREYLIDRGTYDSSIESFRQIDFDTYLKAVQSAPRPFTDRVAVVVAQGAIVGGDQPQGTVGGESTARLIRQARTDTQVKAVVLRVDSPGGSVLPSEQIRREIELTRQAGKPVIVSMSSVAASGGYWISMSADEIWASPTTITGSIGIYGLLTNFPRTLQKVGIHTDGVGTTRIAGATRADRDLPDNMADIIQQIIDDGYERFIEKVADARDMTSEAVDRVARGRVWSGAQARDRGLVDELGGLEDAIASAARHAGISDYQVEYVEKQPSAIEQFFIDITAGLPRLTRSGSAMGWLSGMLPASMKTDLQLLMDQPRNQPVGVYAYCFCSVD